MVSHLRQHNEKPYCDKWTSIRHVLEEIKVKLDPDDEATCAEQLEAQFTSNICRVFKNQRYCGRTDASKKIQKYLMTKENADGHYSNA